MKLPKELLEQLQKDLADSKTAEDLLGQNGAIKNLVKGLMEEMLGGELAEHLGYDKHDKTPKATTNRRNGSSSKTIKSTYGPIPIDIPRDREGSFDPLLIEKHQTDLAGIDEKVIAMYAKGMSTRDIQGYIQEIYGLQLSPTTISTITERVLDHVKEWQARPLAGVYPILYFDAIHFKVREEGRVMSKAAYTVLGIDTNGYKDLLGIWVGESEGAHFWMTVLSEMRNRGDRHHLSQDSHPGVRYPSDPQFPALYCLEGPASLHGRPQRCLQSPYPRGRRKRSGSAGGKMGRSLCPGDQVLAKQLGDPFHLFPISRADSPDYLHHQCSGSPTSSVPQSHQDQSGFYS